jgi:predicted phage terminase large subunit-like protein
MNRREAVGPDSRTVVGLPLDERWCQGLIDALKQELIPEDLGPELTFTEFVREAWPVLEPDTPFVPNWHLDAIAEHLQGVHVGHISNLLINIPPGCSKSRLVSVLFNAWEWTRQPWLRYLCASFEQGLSTRDNVAVRDLVESEWYQSRWPHLQLRHDQNQKTRFDTTRGGWRIGTSVGGRGLGEHPHRKILDDPHNPKQADSDVQRVEAIRWFERTLSRRGVALNAATIVIMQRLNLADLSARLLETAPTAWVHLMLPMRFDPARRCVTVGRVEAFRDAAGHLVYGEPTSWTDPRTEAEELLWPTLFPAEKATDPDPYVDASQLQQQPIPAGGAIFQRDWFQVVEAVPSDVRIVARCRFWDCAATAGAGDYTVGMLLALTHDRRIYVEDMVRGQWASASVDAIIKQTADQDAARYGRTGVRIREEQEAGSAGKSVSASHARLLMGYDYRGIRPTGEKTTRWRPLEAQARAHNVFVLNKPSWTPAWLSEITAVPHAKHDDIADATAGAFNELALTPQNTVTVRKLTGW